MKTSLLGVVLLMCVTLTGCGGGPSAPQADPALDSPHPTSSPSTPVATVTAPTPASAPDTDGDGFPDDVDYYPKNPLASGPETITIICDVQGATNRRFVIDRVRPDFKRAWRTPLPEGRGLLNSVFCEANSSKLTPVSDVEQMLWAADKHPDRYTLSIPYEQCVEHGTRATLREWPRSEAQVPEAQAALLLCPHHPDAAAIRSRIADQQTFASELRQGRSFYDGNYRVGSRIQPGRYVTTNVEDCYWERLDSTGEIIDNNFVSDALRVEVSIAPTDFSFHAQGCGMWRQVD